jgi:DNA-binding response OmpR family regulator
MKDLTPPLVIVVDDDSDDVFFLREFVFSKWPHIELIHFHDSEVFISTFENIPTLPSLVILDINMPKCDGFMVCKALKNSNKWKNVPVVFLSTSESKHYMGKTESLKAYAYLVKPSTEEQWERIGLAIQEARINA